VSTPLKALVFVVVAFIVWLCFAVEDAKLKEKQDMLNRIQALEAHQQERE